MYLPHGMQANFNIWIVSSNRNAHLNDWNRKSRCIIHKYIDMLFDRNINIEQYTKLPKRSLHQLGR